MFQTALLILIGFKYGFGRRSERAVVEKDNFRIQEEKFFDGWHEPILTGRVK